MKHERGFESINVPPVIAALVEVRLAWGLERSEVAKRSGIDIRKLRMYELGLSEPHLRYLRKWAKALGYEVGLRSAS